MTKWKWSCFIDKSKTHVFFVAIIYLKISVPHFLIRSYYLSIGQLELFWTFSLKIELELIKDLNQKGSGEIKEENKVKFFLKSSKIAWAEVACALPPFIHELNKFFVKRTFVHVAHVYFQLLNSWSTYMVTLEFLLIVSYENFPMTMRSPFSPESAEWWRSHRYATSATVAFSPSWCFKRSSLIFSIALKCSTFQ